MNPKPEITDGASATQAPNLVELLRLRARLQPDDRACAWLGDGEDIKGELGFGELDERARALAARLQGLGAGGECVIVLYPPGLDFFSAFFGCLYAGAVAVPLPVPRHAVSMAQLLGIIGDLGARVVMTTATTLSRLNRLDALALEALVTLATEDTPATLARAWQEPVTADDAVAYLQYTSGSTSNRKGVMVTHANVIANLSGIAERFRHHDASVCVNWLPHFHDLGLVGGILQPLFHGHPNIMMSPTAFVQQPIRWLNAITRYRGTYTNSPNYGYDLCVRRTTDEQRAALDLGSLEVALNGAEPVRRQTIDAFSEAFAPCGFRREAMYPAYGLAEATLVVSGGLRDAAPFVMDVDAGALELGRAVAATGDAARALVGCGRALQHTTIAIADPGTGARRADGDIGEIWVNGPGVAGGYWQAPGETDATFRATLAGESNRGFLRTGDLGYLHGDELFITGRLKDLIIVRGGNHYPQDIEWTLEQCHVAFRPGCGAAFAVEQDGEERLVVAFEVEREHLRSLDADELGRIARHAVAEQHELRLQTLVLLKTGTVPRTSSGKIQRQRCRRAFLADELEVVGQSSADVPGPPAVGVSPAGTTAASAGDLVAWLRSYAEDRLNSRLMDERRSITPHVILDFGNEGVLGMQVEPAFGGLGFGHRDALRVIEQLGAIDQTLTMMTIVHNTLGIGPIRQHGAAELRETLLPRLASGRELVAFAITEPVAGSNPQAITSTATPDGPHAWHLRGHKLWSGTAGWASVINVFAQNRDADGEARGMSGFAVPRSTPGLRIGPEAMTLGMRGMVQNAIYLDDARVARSQLLGDAGDGMRVAQDAMMQGRLHIAAACVGGMKRCLQLMTRFAERRSIATGRLLDNPVLLERVGELSAATAAVEALVAHVAEALDAGRPVPPEAYVVCKTAGPEWLWRAADDLVQFLGGRGYLETNLAGQLLRDARVTRILEGPTEALMMFLGSRVVNDGAGMHAFLATTLRAPAVAARLADTAGDVLERCTGPQSRFGTVTEGRRWAYAQLGQVATDAVLLAVLSPAPAGHHRDWAEQRFSGAIARALAEAAAPAFAIDRDALSAEVNGYMRDIGDAEQTLPGEDHALDGLLRRESGTGSAPAAPAPVAPAARAGTGTTASAPVTDTGRRVVPQASGTVSAAGAGHDSTAIAQFIVTWIAAELKIPPGSIDAGRSLFDYGVDSVIAVMLTASLEDWLGVEIYPDVVYDAPVIRTLARHLAET